MNKMPLPITQIFGLFGSFGKLMQFLSTEKKTPKTKGLCVDDGATQGSTGHHKNHYVTLL